MIDVKTVQAAMAKAGKYHAGIDGIFGTGSRAARDAILAAVNPAYSVWPHSRRMVAIWQWTLAQLGFKPGTIDGLEGPDTRAAEFAFRKAEAIGKGKGKASLPWMEIAEKAIGLHETMDNDELRAFLKSDGRTLGDPRKLPWCGDFVETCIRNAFPDLEVPANPYLARNWQDWGEAATNRYGAVIVFWRGERRGTMGHVGFAHALDEARGRVQVLGGNQGDASKLAWLGTDRILAWRAPPGWVDKMPLIGKASAAGAPVSTNEA